MVLSEFLEASELETKAKALAFAMAFNEVDARDTSAASIVPVAHDVLTELNDDGYDLVPMLMCIHCGRFWAPGDVLEVPEVVTKAYTPKLKGWCRVCAELPGNKSTGFPGRVYALDDIQYILKHGERPQEEV